MKIPKWLDEGPDYSDKADAWMRARVDEIERRGGDRTTLSREEVDEYAMPSIATVFIGILMMHGDASQFPEGTVARCKDTWIILRKRDRDEWMREIGTGK